MAEIDEATGWWKASDQKWYPPESHPDYVAARAGQTLEPGQSDQSTREVLASGSPIAGRRLSSRRGPVVIGVVIVVVAAAVAFGLVAILQNNGITTLGPGSGTATITWKSVDQGSNYLKLPLQPFTGTADGLPLKGTGHSNLSALYGMVSGNGSKILWLLKYSGTLGGTSFKLEVGIDWAKFKRALSGDGSSASESLEVKGTYGSQPIRGSLAALNPSARASRVEFRGTIGNLRVHGTFGSPQTHGGTNHASASFALTQGSS